MKLNVSLPALHVTPTGDPKPTGSLSQWVGSAGSCFPARKRPAALAGGGTSSAPITDMAITRVNSGQDPTRASVMLPSHPVVRIQDEVAPPVAVGTAGTAAGRSPWPAPTSPSRSGSMSALTRTLTIPLAAAGDALGRSTPSTNGALTKDSKPLKERSMKKTILQGLPGSPKKAAQFNSLPLGLGGNGTPNNNNNSNSNSNGGGSPTSRNSNSPHPGGLLPGGPSPTSSATLSPALRRSQTSGVSVVHRSSFQSYSSEEAQPVVRKTNSSMAGNTPHASNLKASFHTGKQGSKTQPFHMESDVDPFLAPSGECSWDPHGSSLIELLVSCNVRLLKVGYIRKLEESDDFFPRYQDLRSPNAEQMEAYRYHEVVRGEEIRRHLGIACDLYAVSHAWLSNEHPDPLGYRLEELVAELDAAGASERDLVFLDYWSLPQVDKLDPEYVEAMRKGETLPPGHRALRTEQEERDYQAVVSRMDVIFGSDKTKVIVLPDILEMDDLSKEYTRSLLPYKSRGWCYFELAIARHFGRVCGDVPRKLRSLDPSIWLDMALSGKLVFSDPADLPQVVKVFKRTHYARKVEDLVRAMEEGRCESVKEGVQMALTALNGKVRLRVLQALGQIDCSGFLPSLVILMEDSDSGVRAEAITVLSRLGVEKTGQEEGIIQHFTDGHYAVRCAALEAIGTLGAKAERHRDAIAACLSDTSWTVRETAMATLSKLDTGLPMHSTSIAESLSSNVPSTRVAALGTLFQMKKAAGEHADRVFQVAKLDLYGFVRDAAILTLRSMGRDDLAREAMEIPDEEETPQPR